MSPPGHLSAGSTPTREITVTGDLSPDSLTGKIGSGGCDLRLMDQNGNIDILRN